VGVIREGPSWRRSFLDNTLEVLDTRNEAVIVEVDRVLRQRAALLRNGGRRPSPEVLTTLDVWDDRLARSGSALVEAREALVAELQPLIQKHHDALAGASVPVTVTYGRSWEDDLASALVSARDHDLQRGITSVGPHRDELTITLDGLPSRTHASQGEQRSLALALQLAAHDLATARLGSAPLLLLDDVFSELDPERTRALLAGMPPGQTLLTTALPPPPEVEAARIYRISLDGWTMENPGGDGHGVAV
jgi:DNA replication and repair protein RecF